MNATIPANGSGDYFSRDVEASSCYCTGACGRTGICPSQQPVYYPRPCGHYFPWYGVIPPTYCPICGAYIGPIYTQPYPPMQPTITYVNTTTTAAEQQGRI